MACAPAPPVKSARVHEVGARGRRAASLGPDAPAARAVEQVRRPADVGDPRVPELGEMARRRPRRPAPSSWQTAGNGLGRRAVERDRRQAELLQQRDPRVGEAQVGEEDAVDALRAREVAVARRLLLGVVADDLQQQRLAARRRARVSTPAMNAGKNGSALSSSGSRAIIRPSAFCAGRRRARGRGVRLPAEVGGDAEDALARLVGHARPVVERERHRGRRHAGNRVRHRRSSAPAGACSVSPTSTFVP